MFLMIVLLSNWILLVPPLEQKSDQSVVEDVIRKDLPTSSWWVYKGYRMAAFCEIDKEKMISNPSFENLATFKVPSYMVELIGNQKITEKQISAAREKSTALVREWFKLGQCLPYKEIHLR